MVNIGTARGAIDDFLADSLGQSGATGYVVGVSGGLDSAVTLQLAVEAVGAGQVTGVVMPAAASRQDNIDDARARCDRLGVDTTVIGIDGIVDSFSTAAPFDVDAAVRGNAAVRSRMVLLYMLANHEDRLVLGTSNRTEILVGYFTKWGDEAADVRPLADLYKTEVRELAEELDLPDRFLEKAPTAGMWAGQTDEDELGASYETIDQVLQRYVDDGMSVDEIASDTGLDRGTVERVVELHRDSEHKRGPVPSPGLR